MFYSLKNIKKIGLSLVLATSMVASNLTVFHAQEQVSRSGQLTNARYERTDGNDVYLSFGGGEQAKITFLKDEVFRFNMLQSQWLLHILLRSLLKMSRNI